MNEAIEQLREDYESYWDLMAEAYQLALDGLKEAQKQEVDWLILKHGSSTSGPGKTTIRSMVRTLMRGKDSSPYIIKNRSIQHYSVFVACIRHPATQRKIDKV